MTLFHNKAVANTADFAAGDVGYVPKTLGHYIENTGDTDLVFIEMFKTLSRPVSQRLGNAHPARTRYTAPRHFAWDTGCDPEGKLRNFAGIATLMAIRNKARAGSVRRNAISGNIVQAGSGSKGLREACPHSGDRVMPDGSLFEWLVEGADLIPWPTKEVIPEVGLSIAKLAISFVQNGV